MGAVASLLLAVKRPDLVKALILIDPTILPFSWMWWWYLAKKTGLSRFVPISFRAGRRRPVWSDMRTISDAYSKKGSFRRWKDGFLEGYLEGGTYATEGGMIRLSCSPAWESRIFATCPHDVWRYVPLLRQPVLVIHGETSDTFLAAAARRFRKSSPHAYMLCIKGTGHFVPMERPQEVADAIRDFSGDIATSFHP
jgi:pimeloyl-ACP methyl ester carboxylesterase